MNTIENQYINKSEWGDGPWINEPDKVQWKDETTGLPCLILRNHEDGNLCGYVGVSKGHRWFGVQYGDVDDVWVHGGLTYSDFITTSEDVWWFGFDTGHVSDLKPGQPSHLRNLGVPDNIVQRFLNRPFTHYRSMEYVREQVTELAKQLTTGG